MQQAGKKSSRASLLRRGAVQRHAQVGRPADLLDDMRKRLQVGRVHVRVDVAERVASLVVAAVVRYVGAAAKDVALGHGLDALGARLETRDGNARVEERLVVAAARHGHKDDGLLVQLVVREEHLLQRDGRGDDRRAGRGQRRRRRVVQAAAVVGARDHVKVNVGDDLVRVVVGQGLRDVVPRALEPGLLGGPPAEAHAVVGRKLGAGVLDREHEVGRSTAPVVVHARPGVDRVEVRAGDDHRVVVAVVALGADIGRADRAHGGGYAETDGAARRVLQHALARGLAEQQDDDRHGLRERARGCVAGHVVDHQQCLVARGRRVHRLLVEGAVAARHKQHVRTGRDPAARAVVVQAHGQRRLRERAGVAVLRDRVVGRVRVRALLVCAAGGGADDLKCVDGKVLLRDDQLGRVQGEHLKNVVARRVEAEAEAAAVLQLAIVDARLQLGQMPQRRVDGDQLRQVRVGRRALVQPHERQHEQDDGPDEHARAHERGAQLGPLELDREQRRQRRRGRPRAAPVVVLEVHVRVRLVMPHT
eukprot:Unigene4302_Nuclearia_a/m.13149 Unigene4302_Nuclearia_a/g.13149  ORF Unigene4302_Nuclearia_a/g.13149 Unigene4302_Nuclearia_a/m.13149 type:complete len:534 (-) Unigene4302_Nuclearia_a:30-1631(-)